MPALANAKHERFAQELAKGKTQIEAYRLAGYKPDDGAAARLSGNVRVQERVKEITERAATRAEVSKSWVMERLMRNAQMCLGEEPLIVPGSEEGEGEVQFRRDPAAANQALQLLGKELGMFVDRSISATTTLEELLDRIDGDSGETEREPAGEPEAP
jgi:phage terminase small subunit